LPHPFAEGGKKISLRSYLAMLNFKANHRKVFLADNQGELVSIVGSANAHDASSAHSNIAIEIKGVFGQEIYKTEEAVANLSKNSLDPLPENLLKGKPGANQYAKVSLITEEKIRQAIVGDINKLKEGDKILLMMFYLSDRQVIDSLVEASKRGVVIKIILDPNKDAFGYDKNGIPNRQVAEELISRTNNKIQVRWYKTNGEQFHSKGMLWTNEQEQVAGLILGSANFTKRNIANYNLETDVRLTTRSDLSLIKDVENYFNRLWNNQDGVVYTVDYKEYKDGSWFGYWVYRFEETTGLSSF
jgi:phosphatidylserine/phosphatidylglycerophosphate/cardiolipin synthase-like enzyme